MRELRQYIVDLVQLAVVCGWWLDMRFNFISRHECELCREGGGKVKTFRKLVLPLLIFAAAASLIAVPVFASDLSNNIQNGNISGDMIAAGLGALITLIVNVVARLIPTRTGDQADTKDKILNGFEALTRALLPGVVSMIVKNRKT